VFSRRKTPPKSWVKTGSKSKSKTARDEREKERGRCEFALGLGLGLKEMYIYISAKQFVLPLNSWYCEAKLAHQYFHRDRFKYHQP
jgi:hypothetical protein